MFMCMDAEIARRKAREAHPLKREPFEGSLAAGGGGCASWCAHRPAGPGAAATPRRPLCAARVPRRPPARRPAAAAAPPTPSLPHLPGCVCTDGVGEEHAGLVGAAARSEGGGEGDDAALPPTKRVVGGGGVSAGGWL